MGEKKSRITPRGIIIFYSLYLFTFICFIFCTHFFSLIFFHFIVVKVADVYLQMCFYGTYHFQYRRLSSVISCTAEIGKLQVHLSQLSDHQEQIGELNFSSPAPLSILNSGHNRKECSRQEQRRRAATEVRAVDGGCGQTLRLRRRCLGEGGTLVSIRHHSEFGWLLLKITRR